ncbi:hypothetical protein PR048_021386 [Dryococelus australis]|uniref:DDE-1 domain-containing protein n=1 Tax=Dryococelus australis TaxID=614101 RepID=A0ABQ9GY78_9NEOP|nr:hypothetical protein PR048_021386 [Dryococelus australis]
MRSHLRSVKLEEKALLILDHCPAHPSADLLQSRDGKIKVMFFPKNITTLIQPFKAHYCRELLSAIVNSDDEIEIYLKSDKLKGAVCSVGLAWESLSQATIQHCWKKCYFAVSERKNSEGDETFLGFADCDVQSAHRILDISMTLEDLVSWTDCDSIEPVSETVNEQDIITAVGNNHNYGDGDECESEG